MNNPFNHTVIQFIQIEHHTALCPILAELWVFPRIKYGFILNGSFIQPEYNIPLEQFCSHWTFNEYTITYTWTMVDIQFNTHRLEWSVIENDLWYSTWIINFLQLEWVYMFKTTSQGSRAWYTTPPYVQCEQKNIQIEQANHETNTTQLLNLEL